MPPTTTTTKASPSTVRSIPRLAGSRASCSAPPSPARNEPAVNTVVNSSAWLTPSAPTMARSWVAARTSRPNRVRHSTRCRINEHDGPCRDQHEVVARKAAAENVDGVAQARRARTQQVLRTPQPQRRVVDHEHEREGGEQLEQLGHVIDAAQQHHLDRRTDRRDAECGDERRRPSSRARRRPPSRSCRRDRCRACRASRGPC